MRAASDVPRGGGSSGSISTIAAFVPAARSDAAAALSSRFFSANERRGAKRWVVWPGVPLNGSLLLSRRSWLQRAADWHGSNGDDIG